MGFFDPLPPCPKFGLIHSTKSTQPPLLCLLLDQPPLCADVLYVWSLIGGAGISTTREWVRRHPPRSNAASHSAFYIDIRHATSHMHMAPSIPETETASFENWRPRKIYELYHLFLVDCYCPEDNSQENECSPKIAVPTNRLSVTLRNVVTLWNIESGLIRRTYANKKRMPITMAEKDIPLFLPLSLCRERWRRKRRIGCRRRCTPWQSSRPRRRACDCCANRAWGRRPPWTCRTIPSSLIGSIPLHLKMLQCFVPQPHQFLYSDRSESYFQRTVHKWRQLNLWDFWPPSFQYQIHLTSLPLVRNWPTPSPLSADVICE